MNIRRISIGFLVTILLTSCGTSQWNNFSKRKYLNLKAHEPKQSNEIVETNQESEEIVQWEEAISYEEEFIAAEPRQDLVTDGFTVEQSPQQTAEIWTPPTRSSNQPKKVRPPDDEEESTKYKAKAKRYSTASLVMVLASIGIMLFALFIIALLLLAGVDGIALFIGLWIMTGFFAPALVVAGLGLHFARKSILYDQLDRREPSKKQRTLLWLSFFLIIGSVIPFLAMINYG